MGSKVNGQLPPMLVSTHVASPDSIERRGPCPTCAAAADQSSSTDAQSPSIALTLVVKDVLVRHFGSLKAAAYELKMDPGQLSRDLQTGDFKFKRLDGFEEVKRLLARAMAGTYGDDDPKTRKRRVIRALRDHLDELEDIDGAA